MLGSQPSQVVPVLGAFPDAQLGDQRRLEARRGGVRLAIVLKRI
jgi:hypothetical protein